MNAGGTLNSSVLSRIVLGFVFLAGSAVPSEDTAQWSLTDHPELIVNAYFEEDVSPGPVEMFKARGFDPRDAIQTEHERQPSSGEDGVEFATGGRHLEFSRVGDALAGYRWTLLIFAVNPAEDSDGTNLVTVNTIGRYGNLPGSQMPMLFFEPSEKELLARWRGANEDGPKSYDLRNSNIVADGETWNVVLAYRRHGRLYLNVNGHETFTDAPPTLAFSNRPPENDAISRIGDTKSTSSEWALNALVFGQSELSEAMVQKLVGWATWRVEAEENLPAGHPYRHVPPKPDIKDVEERYTFDLVEWEEHWSRNRPEDRHRRQGRPMPLIDGYERVFIDDFRDHSIFDSTKSEGGESAIWYAPGHNRALGREADLQSPDAAPELYRHDPDSKTLTLSLRYDGGWRGAALYSVNDSGLGRSWENGGIFRVRVKFPDIDGNPGVGYFPAAPWFYNLNHLFWRTDERIEFDGFEFEGIDDRWLNVGSSHVHSGRHPDRFGRLAEDAPPKEIFDGQAWIDVWDGEFHTWEVRIDENVTVLGVDGLEIGRVQTPREYLERLYMILNVALKGRGKEPDRRKAHEMVLDYVEVLKKSEHLSQVPKPFMRRPWIGEVPRVGTPVTCGVSITAQNTDIWYFWYADGYPRGFGISPHFVASPSDVGARLRCMVRVAGAAGQPEAWSAPSAPVEAQ